MHVTPSYFLTNGIRYEHTGSVQLRTQQHIFRHLKDLQNTNMLSDEDRRRIAATLISTSNFSDAHWKRLALTKAEELLHGIDSLILTATRKLNACYVDVSEGNHPSFKDLSRPSVPSADIEDKRIAALAFDGLILWIDNALVSNSNSQAINAIEVLEKSYTAFAASPLGCVMQLKLLHEKVKILCSIGDFGSVDKLLTSSSDACHLVSRLQLERVKLRVRILGEQHHLTEAISLLSNGLKVRGQLIRHDNWRILCLAELHLLLKDIDTAEVLYKKFCSQDSWDQLSIIDKIRFLTGLARCEHTRGKWHQALYWWIEAHRVTGKLQRSRDSLHFVILLSLGHLEMHIGNNEMKDEYCKRAQALYKRSGRYHEVLGLGSHWLDKVASDLQISVDFWPGSFSQASHMGDACQRD